MPFRTNLTSVLACWLSSLGSSRPSTKPLYLSGPLWIKSPRLPYLSSHFQLGLANERLQHEISGWGDKGSEVFISLDSLPARIPVGSDSFPTGYPLLQLYFQGSRSNSLCPFRPKNDDGCEPWGVSPTPTGLLNSAQLCKQSFHLLNHTPGGCPEITDISNPLFSLHHSIFLDASYFPLPPQHGFSLSNCVLYISAYRLIHSKSSPYGKFLIPKWFPVLPPMCTNCMFGQSLIKKANVTKNSWHVHCKAKPNTGVWSLSIYNPSFL